MKFNSLKTKIIFYDIPIILFSLLPFFLITGPFLSDLTVSIICILFLIYCVKEKNFSFFKNKYFYFFLVFWGYLIFNSLINNFNLDSFKISFFVKPVSSFERRSSNIFNLLIEFCIVFQLVNIPPNHL